MKSFNKILTIIITILLITGFFFTSCTHDSDPGPGPDQDPDLLPPESVTAVVEESCNLVTWSNVDSAEMYEIYRNQGAGEDWELLAGNVSDTKYEDITYTSELDTKYAVISISGSERSDISRASNIITRFVQNITATKLEYDDRIVIRWAAQDDASSYVVYRYDNKLDVSPDYLGETPSTVFEDTTGTAGEPYFYRVLWKRQSIGNEIGGNVPLVFGIYDDNIDYHEPNDDYKDIEGQNASTVFNFSQPPYSYSYSDGTLGGVVHDSDWYKYTGPVTILTVKVTLPGGTAFNAGELRLEFFYNGNYYPTHSYYSLREGVNNCGFDSYGYPLPTGDVEVYFKIYTVAETSRNILGSYEVDF